MLVPHTTTHDDTHNTFMTLPPYTSSREDEERQLGSGPKLCRVGLCVLHCPHDSSLERDARVPTRSASTVNAAVLQRKRRTTLTQMRKEKPLWACYVLFHTVGTIACSGMNRTPGPGMLKPWPRCAKSNASLHKSAPGAPRLFASKQASQSSDWGSLTHRPRRSSWCHESWEDEGGHAGLRVARDHGTCIPRALLVVQLKCGATGAPTAACRPHRGPIPPIIPTGLPRYCQPERSTAFLPCATSSWACTSDRKQDITSESLPATA